MKNLDINQNFAIIEKDIFEQDRVFTIKAKNICQ